MKKLFIFLAFIFCSLAHFAQSPPQKMSYQAVIRDANNNLLVSTQVGMRISILQNNAMGMAQEVYVETQTPTTNINGLVSLEVGGGMMVSGTFSGINWALGSCFIKTETDPTGGSNYSISGMSQLLSVPYALYAGSSGTAGNGDYWELHGNSNTLDDGTFFVGTTNNIPLNFKVNNQKAGRIDGANSFFGNLSGNLNTGGNNTASGAFSLSDNTNGGNNTAIGVQAMQKNIIGNQNTAVGSGALLNSDANFNAAFGATSLQDNTTGFNNSAFGTASLRFNLTGNYNTAVGRDALRNNNDGNYNTALGYQANFSATNLNNTTSLGYGALATADNQIRLGNSNVSSLYFGTGDNLAITTNDAPNMYYDFITGQIMRSTASLNNTANSWNLLGNAGTIDGTNFIGTTDNIPLNFRVNNQKAGRIDGTNSFFGNLSGNLNTGGNNTATGSFSLSDNTNGGNNTAFGVQAMQKNIIGNQNTAVGSGALLNSDANFNAAFGATSLQDNTTGFNNSAFGTASLRFNLTGNYNTAVGRDALRNNTDGNYNTALGYEANFSATNLNNSTSLGYRALATADNQIRLGNSNVSSLYFGTGDNLGITNDDAHAPNMYYDIITGQIMRSTASVNTSANSWNLLGNAGTIDGTNFIGTTDNIPLNFRVNNQKAGRIDHISNNSFYGYLSGDVITTGANNSAFGMKALNSNSTGHMNTSIGTFSLFSNTIANGNVGIGESALYLNTTGGYNTAVGRAALLNNTTGERNTVIGEGADVAFGSVLNYATAIGSRAFVEQSNSLILGSINGVNGATASVDVGIGTTTPESKLHIKGGSVKIQDGTEGLGKVLTSDAFGLAHWATLTNNSANSWNLLGNAGTIDGTNFIGTTDNVPLSFKVNNIFAGRIDNMLGNVFFGSASGINNTNASSNTAIGYFSLNTNTVGTSNTALGANTLQLSIGSDNTAVGGGALANNSTGTENVAIGKHALMTTTSGSKNTALGTLAFMSGTLTNSTVIGYGAQTTTSNTIQLGDLNVINVNTAGTYTAGNVTYTNADGVNGQVLTTNGSGVTSWTTVSSTNTSFAVGDSYGGGIVFYVDASGQHGLIAATVDQSSGIQWYNGSYHYTGSTGDGLFAGKMNTTLIVATQIADNYTGNFAAKICGDYAETTSITGDWYLPSKYELSLLYAQKNTVGGFSNANYWSATESDNANAWLQDFTNGTQNNAAKNFTAPRVRAIRSF